MKKLTEKRITEIKKLTWRVKNIDSGTVCRVIDDLFDEIEHWKSEFLTVIDLVRRLSSDVEAASHAADKPYGDAIK